MQGAKLSNGALKVLLLEDLRVHLILCSFGQRKSFFVTFFECNYDIVLVLDS